MDLEGTELDIEDTEVDFESLGLDDTDLELEDTAACFGMSSATLPIKRTSGSIVWLQACIACTCLVFGQFSIT